MCIRDRLAVALRERARPIRLLLTDSDGVLTDNGVYYSCLLYTSRCV